MIRLLKSLRFSKVILYNQVDVLVCPKKKRATHLIAKLSKSNETLLKLTLYAKEEYLKSSQDKGGWGGRGRVSHFFPQRKKERC